MDSGFKFGKRSLSKLVGVHPYLAGVCWEALSLSSVDFGVYDGVRAYGEQLAMIKRGVSKSADSYHLYGLAVDLVPFIDGKYTWESEEAFQEIARAMELVIGRGTIKIDNGLKLWRWDSAHWQMSGFKKEYDVRKLAYIKYK